MTQVSKLDENKKRFDELCDLIRPVPTFTREQLCNRYKELKGADAPETTTDWLIEAVSRIMQVKYFEERSATLPKKIAKNNQVFFSAPVPDRKAEEEKKMKKKEAAAAPASAAAPKKEYNVLLKWKKDAPVDALGKQKHEHVNLMLKIVHHAAEAGISSADLAKKMEKLTDKTEWAKANLKTHVTWLVKKFATLVETAPIA